MYNPDLFAKLESGLGYNKTRDKSILNPYVNFHKHTNTHSLTDALVSESIQMRGVECFYLRRDYVNLDLIFGEDTQSKFEKAYRIAAYIQNFEGYEGQRAFFSKFGMQVNDEITFQVNPGLFKYQTDGNLPKEGDLIYFPMDNSLFELVWVDLGNPFYQTGVQSIITITAAKFVYSGEKLDPKVKVGHGMPPMDIANCPDFDLDLEEITRFEPTPELDPVSNLNGIADLRKEPYAEDVQFQSEGDEFIDPENFDPINGAGEDMIIPEHKPEPHGFFNPFDNF